MIRFAIRAAALSALLPTTLVAAGCGGSRTAVTTIETVTAPAAASATPKVTTTTSFPQLVSHVESGVVRIEAQSCGGLAIGTGFLVGGNLVATVEHVIDGASMITIKRHGVVLGSARVIGADQPRDLALLKTSSPIIGHVFRLAPRSPQLGEAVAAFGFPLGLPLTVTRGSVSGLDRAIPIDGVTRHRLVQTDAAVNHGNSGGPLLAADTGDVVGLVDLGTTLANGLAFAVSSQVAEPLFRAWTVAPQPSASSACAANPPQAAPAQAPSQASGAKAAIAETVYGYWDSIQQGDYATAFSYLTPPEGAAVGGEATFISQHQADPLTSVDVVVAVTALSSTTATAGVVRLRTIAPRTGCRSWSGSYQLAYEGGQWLISRATLNFTGC